MTSEAQTQNPDEKVLIWKGLWQHDFVTVKSCLELNGIEVELRNEMAATVLSLDGAATGGAHLWIFKRDYEKAVATLYDNGYLSEKEFLESKGIGLLTNEETEQQKRGLIKVLFVLVPLIIIVIIVVLLLIAGDS